MARLGDVCTFYAGTGFPNEYQGNTSGEFPFFKVGDISKNVIAGNRKLVFCDNYIDSDIVSYLKGTIVPRDTIVFAKIGEGLKLNRRAITSCDCLIDNNVIGIRANNDILDTSYFYYFMCTLDLQKYCETTAVPSVRKSRIMNIEIYLPPLDEQRKITAVLDKISDLTAKRRRQLDKLDELVKSRFVEMFGTYPANERAWQTCTIRDVVSDVCYGSSRPSVDGGAYPYLRMNNITYAGELDLSDVKRIDVPKSELSRCTVRRGDVLFNRTNSKELVGKTCVYDRDEMMVLAGFIIRVRVNDKILPEFLSTFLNADFSKQMLLGKCKTAIGQANINANEMQSIGIYLPPLELQSRFVEVQQQTRKLKSIIQRSLTALETLKKSLMQEYFSAR